MASGIVPRLALASCAMASMLGAQAFVPLAIPLAKTSHLERPPVVLPHGRLTSDVTDPVKAPRRSVGVVESALPALSLGVALVGLSAAKRRVGRIRRRVTLEDIEKLELDFVPSGWNERISIGMSRRNDQVESIKEKLETTVALLSFTYHGMNRKQLAALRAELPHGVACRTFKTGMMRKALERTPWEPFRESVWGANMYVFIEDDSQIKETYKAIAAALKQMNRDAKIAQLLESVPDEFNRGLTAWKAAMIRDEWEVIPEEKVTDLENFVSKKDLIARVAGGIKQVPTKIGKGTKLITQKIAIGTKKIQEKMEEQGVATIGEVKA